MKLSPGCNCCTTDTLCVHATANCPGGGGGTANLAGATVTVKLGGTTVATGTTNATGDVCFPLAPNTYTISLSATGYRTDPPTTVTTGSGTTNVTVNAYWSHSFAFTVKVRGCGNDLPLSGGTVNLTVTGPGGYSASGTITTTGGGFEFAVFATGTYSITASYLNPRFADTTVNFTYSNPCLLSTQVTVTLTVGAAYTCNVLCALPLKQTLALTDTRFGAVTLTWDGTSSWTGSATGTDCATGHAIVVQYQLGAITGSSCRFEIAWTDTVTSTFHSCNLGGCFDSHTLTCPPSSAFVYTSNINVGPHCQIYCSGTDGVTITE